jgi:hypothetical protein
MIFYFIWHFFRPYLYVGPWSECLSRDKSNSEEAPTKKRLVSYLPMNNTDEMSFKPMYNCITFLKRWLIIIFLLIRWNEANMVNYLEDDAYTDKEYLLTFHTLTSSSNNNVVDDKRSPKIGLPIFHPPILTWSFRRRRPWQRRQRRPWLPLKMERKQEKFDAAGKTGKNFRWGEKKKS